MVIEEPPSCSTMGWRERKKHLTRQRISDVATQMFLERGFDGFRIAEVAEACGVSEKTVYNYFPTKESLIIDVADAMVKSVRHIALTAEGSLVDAFVERFEQEIDELWALWSDPTSPATIASFGRFGDLLEATPTLRAFQADLVDQLVRCVAEALAERTGRSLDDPELHMVAEALIALWKLSFRSMRASARADRSADELRATAKDDVRAAAALLRPGFDQLRLDP